LAQSRTGAVIPAIPLLESITAAFDDLIVEISPDAAVSTSANA
jgi:hypothetical protein